MAESGPVPVSQDDDDCCDSLFKLKHCRRKLRDEYHRLVFRVWQWNILVEGLTSAVKQFSHFENGNGDAEGTAEKRIQILEETLENWERSFDDNFMDDNEFKELLNKSKENLRRLKDTVTGDDGNLDELKEETRALVVLAKVQRQQLSRECGNVETHGVSEAIKKLWDMVSKTHKGSETQTSVKEVSHPASPNQGQSKKKKDENPKPSSHVDKIVKFFSPSKDSLQYSQTVFSSGAAKNVKAIGDVDWLEACVCVHDTVIAVAEMTKSRELYKNLKKICNHQDAKGEARQKIQEILGDFVKDFMKFFAKVTGLVERVDQHLPEEKLKQKSKKLRKNFEERKRELIQKIGLPLGNVSKTPGEELGKVLTAGQYFSMLTECHDKVKLILHQRIDLECEKITAEERRKNCRKIMKNCSSALKQFLETIKEEDVVTCMQCENIEEQQRVNQSLRERNLSMEDEHYIKSSLQAEYSSKKWKEIRMLKQVVQSLKQDQEIGCEARKYLYELLNEWHQGCCKQGSMTAEGEETLDAEHQDCLNICKAYEAVKTSRGRLPASVCTFLQRALVDPSESECCKKVLYLSEAFEKLQRSEEPTEEQIKYLLEEFPESAACKSCTGMGMHKKNDSSERKYKEKLRLYLEEKTECVNCQDMLQSMNVYEVLSDNRELSKQETEDLVHLLKKFESKWNCKEEINCIKVIERLSGEKDETSSSDEDVEKYVTEKLTIKEHPCEYCKSVLHKPHEDPKHLRDYLLKNSCESCSMLMALYKVRKTLGENKFLSNNLREIMCRKVFPKTDQCKACHQWSDCVKMLEASGTFSEDHKKNIHHILDSTASCKKCRCDGDVDDTRIRQIISQEDAAAEPNLMKAVKECWESGLKCKECHRNLIHWENTSSEGNTKEELRLKNFIWDLLKKDEQRLHCEVCEGFFVPENPIVLKPLSLENVEIIPSGCSKAEDIKKFKQAAIDQLEERGGCPLKDTFVYPSENKSRKRHGSGKSKGAGEAREDTKGEAWKRRGSGNVSEKEDGGIDEAMGEYSKIKDEKTTQQAATDQSKVGGGSSCEGRSSKMGSCRVSFKQGRGAGTGITCKVRERQDSSAKGEDETKAEIETTPVDGSDNEVRQEQYPQKSWKEDLGEYEGINEVVGIFQEWGRINNVPLCILKNYNYGELQKTLKVCQSTITKNSGDFDILVISRHLGVILVEMKATRFNSTKLRNALGKVKEQLHKNEMVFYEINKDWLCPSRIPIVHLMAFPNITCQQLMDNGVCERDRGRVLSKCRIQYLKKNPRELDKLIGLPTLKCVFTEDDYCYIMAHFFSVEKLIAYHCLDEGLIRNTGRKMRCMLLTDAQNSLIRYGDNPFQILAGDYGTGKSLMLTEKAKLIARGYKKSEQKKSIIVISCTDITVDGTYLKRGQPTDSVQHLRNFAGDQTRQVEFNYFDHIEFHMTGGFIKQSEKGKFNLKDLEAAIVAIASQGDTDIHLLFDEMPLNFMKMFKERIDYLKRTYKSVLKTFWVSIATHSFRVTVLEYQDPKWIREYCPQQFEFCYLKKNLRVPGKVLDLHKAIEWFNGDGHVDTNRGDIPLGPMPLLYRVPECVCDSQSKRSHNPRTTNPLNCGCSQRRMVETLRRLFKKIGILEEVNGMTVRSDKEWPRSVTMLLFAVESTAFRNDVRNLLLASFQELHIPAVDGTYIRGKCKGPSDRHPNASDGKEGIAKHGGKCSHKTQENDMERRSPTLKGSDKDSNSSKLTRDVNQPKKESQSNQKILLTTETSFIGCESEVLICVDLNGMLHWYPNGKLAYTTSGISRCLSQYIHLTWMPSEAKRMFKEQMKFLVDDGDVKQKDIEDALRQKENCLERVLNQFLIQEQEVKMPENGAEKDVEEK